MNVRVRVGRVSRILVVASAASAALLLGVAASASAGTLDQQQTSFNTNAGLFTNQSGAETFTAGITGVVDQADLNLLKVGTPPATVTVEIRTTSGGIPTATVLTTGTIATSAIGATGAFLPVTFATPAPVTAGTQYALVAYSGGMAATPWGGPLSSAGALMRAARSSSATTPSPRVPAGLDFRRSTSRLRPMSGPPRHRRTRPPRTRSASQRPPGTRRRGVRP